MVHTTAQTVKTALGPGRTARGVGAHLTATVALRPMGAARALEMTVAQAPRATMVMTSAVAHQEEVSPLELKSSQPIWGAVCRFGCNSYIFSLRQQTVFAHFSDLRFLP